MNQVQKNIDKSESYIRQNEVANPFGQNVSSALLYKKIERIVVATTYILAQIKDNQTLRDEVQVINSQLLKDAIVLKDGFRASGQKKTSGLLGTLRMLMTYTDILRASRYISDSNLELLKAACGRVVTFVQSSEQSPLAEAHVLAEDLLGKGHEYVREVSGEQGVERGVERAEKSVPYIDDVPVPRISKPMSEVKQKQHAGGARKAPAKQVYTPKGNNERRGALLAVIDSRGAVTIRDLVSVVPDISEKTIQRELQAMIVDGLLKKEGDRRWTTYSRV
jgi:hypothetical protein